MPSKSEVIGNPAWIDQAGVGGFFVEELEEAYARAKPSILRSVTDTSQQGDVATVAQFAMQSAMPSGLNPMLQSLATSQLHIGIMIGVELQRLRNDK